MDFEKLLRNTSKEGVVEGLAEFYEETQKENKTKHLKHFQEELKVSDILVAQYLLIGFALSTTTKEDKFSNRPLICENYMYTIVNNFHTLKSLFICGNHIQFQLLLRSQFEFVLTFICALFDDDFFKTYTTPGIQEEAFPLTPSQSNRIKCLNRIFKALIPNKADKLFKQFHKMWFEMYQNLSEIGHGNILRVFVQSFQKEDDGSLIPSYGGSDFPLGVTLNAFLGMLNYYQLVGRVLVDLIDKKQLINEENVSFNFLKSNLNTIESFFLKEDAEQTDS